MPTDWKAYIPLAIGLFGALVGGLFAMFRADNIRAGEQFPTKLAIAQTFSTLRNGRELLAMIRGKSAPPPAPREFKSVEEMKATITPGVLRAEDVGAYAPPRRSPAKSDAVE